MAYPFCGSTTCKTIDNTLVTLLPTGIRRWVAAVLPVIMWLLRSWALVQLPPKSVSVGFPSGSQMPEQQPNLRRYFRPVAGWHSLPRAPALSPAVKARDRPPSSRILRVAWIFIDRGKRRSWDQSWGFLLAGVGKSGSCLPKLASRGLEDATHVFLVCFLLASILLKSFQMYTLHWNYRRSKHEIFVRDVKVRNMEYASLYLYILREII